MATTQQQQQQQAPRPVVQTRQLTVRPANVNGQQRVVVHGTQGTITNRDIGILLHQQQFINNVNDPHVQILIKRIVKLTLIMAIVAITRNVVLLYYQHYISLIEMLVPLMIPYCGYEGARRRNRALVNCFWGCSAFILTLYMLQLLFAVNYFIQTDERQRQQSSVDTQGLMISLITGGVAAIFQSVACIWGRQLAHSDYMIHVSHRTQNGNNFVGQREHVLADGSIVYVTNIGQLGTNQQRPQQGVPAERLASFRTKVLDEQAMQAGDWDTKGKNSTCVICLDDFQAGARVKTLPCGHLFHDACIDQWLHSNTRCPNCNHDCLAAV